MISSSPIFTQHILLAEDDDDDCFLFKLALEELPVSYTLTIRRNGEELMTLLNTGDIPMPDVLFLDLNMPRKSGLECLAEIKNNHRFNQLPVIIFTTSFSPDLVQMLYDNGAQFYVRKPNDIEQYKKVIFHALHKARHRLFKQRY